MTIQQSRWLDKEVQHFDASVLDKLTILLDPAGGLSATAAGLRVTADATNGRGTLNPAAGTIALPTAGGAETTQNNGVAYQLGDWYLVTSPGTVGTTVIPAASVPAMFMYNGGDTTTDAGWSLLDGPDVSNFVANTRQIISGNGLTGGGDLSADRTLAVQPDTATGGDVKPVSVTANGVGLDQSTLVGDQLTVTWNPGDVTPDAAGAIANGAPAGTVATDVAAILEGLNDKINEQSFTVQRFTLAAGDITGGVTLSGTPTASTETILDVAGAPNQQYTDDYTVAGTTLTFTAALQALLTAGDKITVMWR